MRQHGYTLIELTVAVGLMALLGTVMLALSTEMRRADRTATEYATDLAQCRRALRKLEGDLRLARPVASGLDCSTDHDSFLLRLPRGPIGYTLVDGVLSRTAGAETRVLARCIGSLTARPRNGCIELRLALRQRRADTPEAFVQTCVAPRLGRPE